LDPPSSTDIDQAITKAVSIAQKSDKRKSPTEVPPSEEKTGRRFSGGRFGKQSSFATKGSGNGKKKLRGK
jgi:hypothetical protein